MIRYTGRMDIRRATFGAAVRLGIVLSTIATILVLGISTIADVTPSLMAATVAAVGFVTSWVLTGRVARTAPVAPSHRVSVVSLRQRVG
jgi:hypothetical protein